MALICIFVYTLLSTPVIPIEFSSLIHELCYDLPYNVVVNIRSENACKSLHTSLIFYYYYHNSQ